MYLNRRELEQLKKIRGANKIQVRRGARLLSNWQNIIDKFQLHDHVQGQYLELNEAIRQQVFEQCQLNDIDLDVNYGELNYLEAAPLGNEKLAGIKPHDQYLLVRELAATAASSTSKGIKHFEAIGWRVHLSQLNIEYYQSLLIIENQTAFDQLDKFKLPRLPTPCLAVYRGDNKNSPKALKHLLKILPDSLKVLAFCDADPAGLAIALQQPKISAVLLPELIPEYLLQAQSQHNQNLYREQFAQQQYLLKHLPKHPLITNYWQKIDAYHCAYLQELILSQSCPLKLVSCGKCED